MKLDMSKPMGLMNAQELRQLLPMMIAITPRTFEGAYHRAENIKVMRDQIRKLN